MKIVYAAPGQDPLQVARELRKKRVSGGFELSEHWWIVALVLFVGYSVTLGPFKGALGGGARKPAVSNQAAVATVTPAPTPVLCDFNGVLLPPGRHWIGNRERTCTHEGTWLDTESATAAGTATTDTSAGPHAPE